MTATKPRAVVLLSGGLDSATCLAIAHVEGFDPYALTLRYGQRHVFEIQAAQRIADSLGVCAHITLDVNLGRFGGSAVDNRQSGIARRDLQTRQDRVPARYAAIRRRRRISDLVTVKHPREDAACEIERPSKRVIPVKWCRAFFRSDKRLELTPVLRLKEAVSGKRESGDQQKQQERCEALITNHILLEYRLTCH